MHPVLRDGDILLARPARLYWPGQVLVFVDQHGLIYCHRLLAVIRSSEGWKYCCKGDHSPGRDEPVGRERILGRVVGLLREDRRLSLPVLPQLWHWAASLKEVICGR